MPSDGMRGIFDDDDDEPGDEDDGDAEYETSGARDTLLASGSNAGPEFGCIERFESALLEERPPLRSRSKRKAAPGLSKRKPLNSSLRLFVAAFSGVSEETLFSSGSAMALLDLAKVMEAWLVDAGADSMLRESSSLRP